MKNLVLIIAAVLVSFTALSQNSFFDEYDNGLNNIGEVDSYKKTMYTSDIDHGTIFHYWGDYTEKGMKIIIDEANRILESYGSDIFVSKDKFLNPKGWFYTGVGSIVYSYNLPDGGVLHIGFEDIGVVVDDINVKLFEMWVKYPNK